MFFYNINELWRFFSYHVLSYLLIYIFPIFLISPLFSLFLLLCCFNIFCCSDFLIMLFFKIKTKYIHKRTINIVTITFASYYSKHKLALTMMLFSSYINAIFYYLLVLCRLFFKSCQKKGKIRLISTLLIWLRLSYLSIPFYSTVVIGYTIF